MSIYKKTWDSKNNGFFRSNLNDTSIGIEVVNMGDRPFPEIQVDAVAFVAKGVMQK